MEIIIGKQFLCKCLIEQDNKLDKGFIFYLFLKL